MTALFAVAHLAGFLQAAWAARHDPGLAALTAAMRAHRADLFGFRPSMLDFREYFSLDFSILLGLAAAAGFAALRSAAGKAAMVRALAPWYAAAFALLLGTSIAFHIFQGIVTCGVLSLGFAVAARRSSGSA